jgi:hypothetical protein
MIARHIASCVVLLASAAHAAPTVALVETRGAPVLAALASEIELHAGRAVAVRTLAARDLDPMTFGERASQLVASGGIRGALSETLRLGLVMGAEAAPGDFGHPGGRVAPLRTVAALPRNPLELLVLASSVEDRAAGSGAPAADLIGACRRGDRSALESVFRAHAEPLARLLTRIVGPSIDIEDLLQDTFAAAIPAFRTFRGEASIKTWLHRPAALAALALAAATVAAVVLGHDRPARPSARLEAAVPEPPSNTASRSVSPSESIPAPSPLPAPADRPAVSPPAPVSPPSSIADATAAGPSIIEHGALLDEARDQAHAITRGAEVPANTPLRAAERTRVRLASLRVVIAASSELRWMPAERMVVLARGTLSIEAGAGDPARVVTERFEVELADAALTVDPAAVRVARGVVRVLDRSRRPLARVAAGATWKPSPAPGPSRRPAAPSSAAAPSTSAAASACDDAEARMFLAEVAHANGELDLAVERYLDVATRFGDPPAGESALYAAARIELRRSRAAAARALLTRYLARYPAGRYADDVRRELATLP